MTGLEWGLPVVAKYLFGGLSAGSFVTYYLWQGLGMKAFRPLAKLAWISAAVWGLAIPIPIFAHLGQPGRFSNLLTDFHWTSPMAWAGPILIAYLAVVLLNGRFFFYRDVVLAYRSAKGLRRFALRVLLLTKPPKDGIPETSSLALKVTGALGIVLVLFFGYTGLELGIIPSRPLWANPMNPLMFLLTGLFSGMAWVALMWVSLERAEAAGEKGKDLLASPALPVMLASFLGLNAISYLTVAYASPEVQSAVMTLATGELATVFLWVGLGLGVVTPLILLGLNAVSKEPSRVRLAVSSLLILIGAFAQKYGFLVAGQVDAAPAGGTYEIWPTSTEVVEFVAILALVAFLFQVALWVSPWRRVVARPDAAAQPREVVA